MPDATPIRLVLVDDDPLVRAGLQLILGGAPDIEVVDAEVGEEDATVEIPVRLAPEREDRSEHAGATRVDGDAARTRLPHGSSEEPAASSDDSAGAVADESSGGNATSR